jgi:SAM-dependent methyltransferase
MSDHQPRAATTPGPGTAPGPAPAHSLGPGSHEHGPGPAGHDQDEAALTELLDLDGEVLRDYLDQATAWIAARAQPPVTRLVDLGAGTGTGTFALLRRFPESHVTAVDLDERRLHHLSDRARDLHLAGRLTVVPADLDHSLPDLGPAHQAPAVPANADRSLPDLGHGHLAPGSPADPDHTAVADPDRPGRGPADLVWASMALHHLADPVQTLSRILTLLRPGGSLAVAETSALESFPRFLPAGVPVADADPGLEDRVHHLLATLMSAEVPHLGADWGPRLTAAGFELTGEQTFTIALDPPLPARTGRYAQLIFDRLRAALSDRLSHADQQALAALAAPEGPASVLHRQDLQVRATRHVWLARRP